MKHTITHTFKCGQKIHLDEIYNFCGLGDDVDGVGHWWEADEPDGDNLTISQDISITITIRTPKVKKCQ